MKKMVILFIIGSLSISIWGYQLRSNTAYGELMTRDGSQEWDDVVSVEIDVTNVDNVMVFASINMRPEPNTNTQAREANYNIYRSGAISDSSGVIKRQIKHNNEPGVMSWGVGTLVHIFDASSLSGNVTYTIEHSNRGGMTEDRNVWSEIQLTAVALNTLQSPYYALSNDVKRIIQIPLTHQHQLALV
ncbi:MAG: hypothetical protein HOK80_03410 [Candidatus Cloacimonetes bacterium]|nr:hypothetical protein [Candidatus Cloacimonadota bacterium]MBT5419915.1 hypothetical protein [Candidatus Cloacimonadota bacterium]